MKVYVIRHGKTNYNRLGLYNSDPAVDVHLTAQGVKTSKTFAQKLSSVPLDVIFVSRLPRTHQTAEIINQNRQLPIIEDARLDDIKTGFEGQPVMAHHVRRVLADDPYTFRETGQAESAEDVYHRICDFVNFLKTQNYNSVLIITSKHCIRHFKTIFDASDPRQFLQVNIKDSEILQRDL